MTSLRIAVVLAAVLAGAAPARAGGFIFAGESNGEDVITHPIGYYGAGGHIEVSVCIEPKTPNATEMVPSIQNAVLTYNALAPTTGNLKLGANNDIPGGFIDLESTVVHEIGHCVGLSHVNAATESGLSGADRNYTRATNGANNVYDIAPGVDGIIGSDDDIRGDDVNLHWFVKATNDPFAMPATVDSTTYSRSLADLPASHLFAANADRTLATALGYPNTEAVMQQGAFSDEDQRQLTPDDVATLRLGMSGLDMLAGTPDDYTFSLSYQGIRDGCGVMIAFDDDRSGFATCFTSGSWVGPSHVRITSAEIAFHTGYNWHYSAPVPQVAPPCPATPNGSCVTGFAKPSVLISDRTAGKEKLAIHWKKGPAMLASQFGDPTVLPGTTYAACVYDDGDILVGAYTVPRATDVCGKKECWRDVGPKGFRFSDRDRTVDGIRVLRLQTGGAGATNVTLLGGNNAAKGHASLPTGVAAALAGSTRATVQLMGSDAPDCISATLTKVGRNDGVEFNAR